MLQFMRERAQGWLAWLIVIVICIVFILWGAEDIILSARRGDSSVATVHGRTIDLSEVDIQAERAVKQQNLQDVDMRAYRQQLTTAVVERKSLVWEAERQGYHIPASVVLNTIAHIPDFMVDGQFSADRYHQIISSALYSDSSFRDAIYQDMLLGQLQSGFILSAFLLPHEQERMGKLLAETRAVSIMSLDPKDFLDKVSVTTEELKVYFDAHSDDFRSPDKVSVDYVELTPEFINKKISLNDADLKEYYQAHQRDYNEPDSLKVAHILIAKDTKDAKVVAQSVYDKLKDGASFAALAKEYSADTLSAAKGGELDEPLYEKDKMSAFEEAAFALAKPGDITKPVESSYGYHVLLLKKRNTVAKKTLEQVRAKVMADLKQHQAEEIYEGLASKMMTQAYDVPDTLAGVASETGLEVKTSGLFSQQEAKGLFADPKLLKAAFSNDLRVSKNNSDLIDLGKTHAVVLRINTFEPAVAQPFEAVASDVARVVKLDRAITYIRNAIEANQVSTKSVPWKESWKREVFTRQSDVDPSVLKLAYAIPEENVGKMVSIYIKGHFVLLKLNKITNAPMDKQQAESMKRVLARIMGETEFGFYVAKVREGIVYKTQELLRPVEEQSPAED